MWKNILFIAIVIGLFGLSFTVTFLTRKSKPQPLITLTEREDNTFSPTLPEYELHPPSNAMNGIIESIIGEVDKTDRDATEAAEARVGEEVVEGDTIRTGEESNATITFATGASLNMRSETTLSFASMNPQNFLMVLPSGEVTIHTDNTLKTISVRSLRGLFTITNGQAQITHNSEDGIIEFTVEEGTGQVGYINAENNTQMVDIAEGETIFFDNNARTIDQ